MKEVHPGAAPVIVASGVTKIFAPKGGTPVAALSEVSLMVAAGSLTALVGPDGAGKTTMLRMAAGLLAPGSGSLQVLGMDVAANPQEIQDRISYMPQRFGLYEDLSVQENLDLYADLHGVPAAVRKERFARLLAMMDMQRFTSRPAGKLSGGMKQKLGLACALVRSPELLLLDEPTVGVDPLSRRELWSIVQQLVDAEHLSVIVSTSYMDEAERCAQVYVMHEGRILAEGTPDAIKARADGLCFVAAPSAGMGARALQSRLIDASHCIIDAVPEGGHVRFIRRPDASEADLGALLAGAAVTPAPSRLEDGFMMVLQKSGQGTSTPAFSVTSGTEGQPAVNHNGPVIEVRDLVRKFDDFTAVASTSFSVHRGEIFGLLGPNGAGKTTTFRMLCGLLPATSGYLQVANMNLRTARAQARSKVGYVAQKFSLYGNLSVRENLDFFGGAYGLGGAALERRTKSVMQQFEVDGQQDLPAGQLPGGFKQRLAMATGLLHEPEILFLDEPTSGADPLARRAFWRRISALALSGVTIVVTTHFMEEAEYCDRIVIQDAGKVLALGTPKQVREQAEGAASMEQAFISIVEANRRKQEAV